MKTPRLRAKFQRNLKRAMDHRGIKQQQLATVAHVGQSSVGRILRGEQSPTLDIVEQLAAALGLDPWLLLVDDFTPESALGLKAVSPEEEALYDRLRLAAQDLAKYRSRA